MKMDNTIYILKIIMQYKKKYLILIVLFSVLQAILPFLSLYISQSILNFIQTGVNAVDSYIKYIAMFILINISISISKQLYAHYLNLYRDYLYYELNCLIMNKTNDLSLADYENPEMYNSIQRAEQEIGIRPFNIISTLVGMISSVITLFSSLLILLQWHWFSILGFIVLPFLTFSYFKKISEYEYQTKYNRSTNERKSWYISHLLTKDRFIKEIKLFDLNDYLVERFKDYRFKFHQQNKYIFFKKDSFSLAYQLTNTLISSFLAILAFYEAIMGYILVGNVMTYINVVSKIENAISAIVVSYFSLVQDNMYVENIRMYLTYENKTLNNIVSEKQKIKEIKKIKIINLSFKYPNSKEKVLDKINLEICAGENFALVGKNGSGKTTLIKILCGLYDNYEGAIYVNDINLRNIEMSSYKKLISAIFQDYNCYEFTAKENISFGDIQNFDDLTRVREAAKISGAEEFISKLPKGINQQLGNWFEEGIQLSGGQWQKVAISRAFMKKSHLLILDEPSASLDPISEYNFYEKIIHEDTGNIKIFITHRFNNAKFTDKIIVMDKGKIVEFGSHESLIKNKQLYYKMYSISSHNN